jgi:hypothetical protein
MNDNYLSGTIMTEIANLSLLEELWLMSMPLTGTIPSEIGNVSDLLYLRLSDTDLHGTIPDEIYNLRDLRRLDLNDANFTGTISPETEQLTDLHVFRISHNSFTGTLSRPEWAMCLSTRHSGKSGCRAIISAAKCHLDFANTGGLIIFWKISMPIAYLLSLLGCRR